MPHSIHRTIPYHTPTLLISSVTITCNHFPIRPLYIDASEYQHSASRNFSHTLCESTLCRTGGEEGGQQHSCPDQYDDWEQFISHDEHAEFQDKEQTTEPQPEPENVSLTAIDPTHSGRDTHLTGAQIELQLGT